MLSTWPNHQLKLQMVDFGLPKEGATPIGVLVLLFHEYLFIPYVPGKLSTIPQLSIFITPLR